MFTLRWYGLSDDDLDEMSFARALGLANGIVIHEGLEAGKIPAPAFGDAQSGQKFSAAIENRIAGIWNMLFPLTGSINQQEEEAALKAAERFRKQRETGEWTL